MTVQRAAVKDLMRLLKKKVNMRKMTFAEPTPEEENAANEALERRLLDLLREDPDNVTVPPCPDELCREFRVGRWNNRTT